MYQSSFISENTTISTQSSITQTHPRGGNPPPPSHPAGRPSLYDVTGIFTHTPPGTPLHASQRGNPQSGQVPPQFGLSQPQNTPLRIGQPSLYDVTGIFTPTPPNTPLHMPRLSQLSQKPTSRKIQPPPLSPNINNISNITETDPSQL